MIKVKILNQFLSREVDFTSDFRIATNLGCACAALILLPPFSINNFVQGRQIIGIASLAVILAGAHNVWGILNGRFRPALSFALNENRKASMSNQKMMQAIAVLTGELRSDFKTAVDRVDFDHIVALLEGIQQENGELADALAEPIYGYRFDILQKLFKGVN